MIIVTGGAGFIGSNIVRELNKMGRDDILVVDNLTNGTKFRNIVDCNILGYQGKEEFLDKIKKGNFSRKIDAIFHQGACSNTVEWDGAYMMRNNYEYSKELLHYCSDNNIPFIYASSAAVYGLGKDFEEQPKNEKPLNVYGYSKLLFDQYVRRIFSNLKNQVVGLRYFNVYGPREQHKGDMASVIWHFTKQLKNSGKIKLFAGNDGYADGEQLRDFVFVEDVVKVNLWFWQNPDVSGIYNVGTGKARTFNDVALEVLANYGSGSKEYIPFPERLANSYQSFTQADLTALRNAGCDIKFSDIKSGIKDYCKVLL